MNKGLEVIEAVHLFDISADDIEVLVHRQSILHSAVELSDGAVIGQLGTSDMRLPIQYALTYPERSNYAFEKLNLFDIGTLTFEKPDIKTFRCLALCIEAINRGGLAPTAVNGANEEAVKLFLDGKIKFLQIADLVEKALEECNNKKEFTIDDIFEADKKARELVRSAI
jgi:1-deoxy-D-xylulose-5-phosphate reductoisomerase